MIIEGRSEWILPLLSEKSFSAVVTDPPYGLSKEPDIAVVLTDWLAERNYVHGSAGFMGSKWDSFVPGPNIWKEVYRVLKPGGFMLCFAGSRTSDLMGISLRLAGFKIVDTLQYLYGSGMPHGANVGKMISKLQKGVPQGGPDPTSPNHGKYKTQSTEGSRGEGDAGQGYGAAGQFMSEPGVKDERGFTEDGERFSDFHTQLKPSYEPIILAQRPLEGTVAKNALKYGTGGLNVGATRIGLTKDIPASPRRAEQNAAYGDLSKDPATGTGWDKNVGRFPTNVLLDEEAVAQLDRTVGVKKSGKGAGGGTEHHATSTIGQEGGAVYQGMADGSLRKEDVEFYLYGDEGGVSRFFYTSKAAKSEREKGLIRNIPCSRCGELDTKFHEIEGKTGKCLRNTAPTVKPLSLMRYLVRLVTPPGGHILDPFAGSGSTGIAAIEEGFDFTGIELESEFAEIAKARLRDIQMRLKI